MTLTIDLPDKLASQFMARIGEADRETFSINAIADALLRREEEDDFVPIIEQALANMDARHGLIAFEDLCQQWDAEDAARTTAHTP